MKYTTLHLDDKEEIFKVVEDKEAFEWWVVMKALKEWGYSTIQDDWNGCCGILAYMLGVPLSMLIDIFKTWVTKSALEVATYMEEVESRAGQDIWDRENMVSICRRFTAVPSEVWGTLIRLRWRRIELQRAAVDSYSRAADKEVGNDWEADIRGWDTEEAAWVEKSFLPPLMSKKWELKDDRNINTPTYIRVPAEEVAKELELLLLPRFHGKRKGALLQAPEDKEGLASKNNCGRVYERHLWVGY